MKAVFAELSRINIISVANALARVVVTAELFAATKGCDALCALDLQSAAPRKIGD